VLLEKGVHHVWGSLRLDSPGVILRGCGNTESGTVLEGSGKSRETLIRIAGENDRRETQIAEITDAYVSVNALSFKVDNSAGLKSGDLVIVLRPSTKEWISFTGMEDFGGETGWLGWKAGDQDIRWIRTIVSVNGNNVTLDAPVTTALDKKYGGGKLIRCEWAGRVSKVGIENMLLRSEYDRSNPKDEEHRWMAVTIENTDDAWVRQVNFEHFAGSVCVYETRSGIVSKMHNRSARMDGWRTTPNTFSYGRKYWSACYAESIMILPSAPCTGPTSFLHVKSHLPYNYSATASGGGTAV